MKKERLFWRAADIVPLPGRLSRFHLGGWCCVAYWDYYGGYGYSRWRSLAVVKAMWSVVTYRLVRRHYWRLG